MTRVLITGAGGPAAICFMRAVAASNPDLDLYAADCDPYAAGLYLVPEDRRVILPRGRDIDFFTETLLVCEREGIDLLVPTVDAELLTVSHNRDAFERVGTRVLVAEPHTLLDSLDKWRLLRRMRGVVDLPETHLLDAKFRLESALFPLFAKPRRGSGSRGVCLVRGPEELARLPRDGSYLLQEYLPGTEYSVDVCARADGSFVAAVPRERLKVDSGVAVTSRTVADAHLQACAQRVAEALDLRYVANVQFKLDRHGTPRLLEVNPRFPGSMALTVAAGVDMPTIALREAMGWTPERHSGAFRTLAMTRTFHETFCPVDDIQRLVDSRTLVRSTTLASGTGIHAA